MTWLPFHFAAFVVPVSTQKAEANRSVTTAK
jgi:hypothetical protein